MWGKRGPFQHGRKLPFDKLRANGQAFSFALSLSKDKFAPKLRRELDWAQMDTYLARFHSGAVIKRLGYLVDILDLPIPERAQRLQRWRSQLGAGIVLLEPGSQPAGVTLRRWRIRDNLGLTAK